MGAETAEEPETLRTVARPACPLCGGSGGILAHLHPGWRAELDPPRHLHLFLLGAGLLGDPLSGEETILVARREEAR